MIHYNVWFSLRDETEREHGLQTVRAFLEELGGAGAIAGFRLLENSGTGERTKLPRYQALIEFRDEAQFAEAMSAQSARGIHTGLHGLVISVVSDFRVEVFHEIPVIPVAHATG